ncbi:30S ribosomal protein S2 [Marinicauda salina]|uniref:Small ribosomal subunit protein uS2 n=1 Tax=Marinicauda salina TaxID=2135793 RepID=A0A2U2BTC1_9PROT|nr:30S ribosomal protein S2 [Marinicauda salina]
MALPEFSMRQLLEAGAHFGHQTHRWNPKMKQFIFGERANIHIIDLSQSVPLMHQALVKIREVAANGGRILFVGTKRQASEPVAQAAGRCAQYFINHRWLGGTLTNWRTISHSIARLRELEDLLDQEGGPQGLTKKEILNLSREREKLERSLGGIKEMGGTPDLMFVIDTNKESIAIQEAKRLNIPVVAVVDTNCDPDPIDFPIPGNDDAARAISLYCELVADSVLDGIAESSSALGVDLGESEAPVEAAVTEEAAPAEAAPAEAAEAPAETEAPAAEAAAEPAKAEGKAEEAPAAEKAAEKTEEAPAAETKAKASKSTAKTAAKKPASKTASKTATKSTAKSGAKTATKSAAKSTTKTESKSTAKSTSKTAAKSTTKAASKTTKAASKKKADDDSSEQKNEAAKSE